MSKFNYFDIKTIIETSFPVEPQVSFEFIATGIVLLNKGSITIEYSFDGISLHGNLNPNDASVGMTFDNRHESKIWFRVNSGFADIRVEAWTA